MSMNSAKTARENGWYCIVMVEQSGERDYGPIWKYEDGCWFDEYGDERTSIWCPVLQQQVPIDAADDFVSTMQGDTPARAKSITSVNDPRVRGEG